MAKKKDTSGREELLSPKEAAKMLGIHYQTLYNMTRAGRIPVVRVVGIGTRYRRSRIEQIIDEGDSEKNPDIKSLAVNNPAAQYLKGKEA